LTPLKHRGDRRFNVLDDVVPQVLSSGDWRLAVGKPLTWISGSRSAATKYPHKF
jgi:hypothetical protein